MLTLFTRFTMVACAITLLSGCISLHVPTTTTRFTPAPATTRQQQLAQLTQWTASGAFSVRQQQHTDLANFSWQQHSLSRYQVRVSSSLNLYHLIITANNNTITLNDQTHPPIRAASPEALLQQTTGYRLPIRNLIYWSRGLPAPGPHQQQLDQYGHIHTLNQQGWKITYRRYTAIQHVDLPQLIDLTRPGLRIRIAIKQWKLT